MLCDHCKAICVDEPVEEQVREGNTTYYYEFPFKESFDLLVSSAQSGCRCCKFLQYCLESHDKFATYRLEDINTAPVFFKWFEACVYEDGGAYLSLQPLNSTGDQANDKLDVKLEIYTKRGKTFI